MLFKKTILLLLTIFICTTCAFSSNNLEKISLQLQWKHQFEFAGFYAAKEKGFYKDVGLDVELREFDNTTNVINDVISNKVTYGTTYSSLIKEYLNGKSLIFIANFLKRSPLVFAVQNDIKTPYDLKNKKVMAKEEEYFTLKLILNKYNLTIQDINKIPTSFNLDDFINKKIDAMALFSTNELYNLTKSGVKYNIFDPSVYGANYYDLNLFTSQQELLQNPKRVKDFKEATIKGWKYALSNKKELINIIIQKYNTQNKTKEELVFEANQVEQLMLTKLYEIGSIDKYRIKMILNTFIQLGIKDNRYDKDLDSFIYRNKRSNKPIFTIKEKNYIKDNEVTIGMIKDYYPFSFEVGKNYYGYSFDYLNLLTKKSGLKFQYDINNWSVILNKFKNKKIDLIDAISYNKEREEFTNYSKPYYNIPNVLFSRKSDFPNYEGLISLKGKNIGITKDIYYYEKIKNLNLFKLIEFKNSREKIKALAHGKIDAAFNNLISGQKYIQQGAYSNIKVLEELDTNTVKKEDLRIGVKKDDLTLFSIINKSINSITLEETIELNDKWFSPGIKTIYNNNLKLSNKEKEYLETKKEIKMCVDPHWMPIEMIEDNTHIGLASDYMKIFSRMINTPINLIKTTTWEESLVKAKNRECDILSLASKTPSRSKYMDFTSPYFEVPIVLATKMNVAFISNLKNIKNKKIGIVKGYSLIQKLKNKFPNINIVEVNSLDEGLRKVENDELFAYLDNSIVINHAIQKDYINTIKVSSKFKDTHEMNIATRNDEKILYEIFEKAVKSLDKNIKHQLHNKWINIQYKKSVDYDFLFKIYFVLFLFFTFLIYRQYVQNNNNKELKDAYNYVQAILDTTLESIIITKKGLIIDCNKEALKQFNYKEKEEILGKYLLDCVAPEFKSIAKDHLSKDFPDAYEIGLMKANKEIFPAMIKAKKIISRSDELRVSSILNISDIKEKESLLLHQSKMASMGEMLNNIAHQWRQPLSIISTYSSGLKLMTEYEKNIDKPYIISTSDAITKQAQYLSNTIEDFRNYFRSDENTMYKFNIKDTVYNIESLIKKSFESNNISIVINSNDIMMSNKENLIIQILINIANNSKDAFKEKEKTSSESFLFIDVLDKIENITIIVKDNAGGIKDEIITKVFEPYFTTKHQSVGTGIGLYMTYQIVTKQLEGDITAKNKYFLHQNKKLYGAEFSITIPKKFKTN